MASDTSTYGRHIAKILILMIPSHPSLQKFFLGLQDVKELDKSLLKNWTIHLIWLDKLGKN